MNASLDLLRKAELRHATAVELVSSLESKMAEADAEWAAAVSADDGDAESAAGKRRTALKPLLADATAKLPLVAEAVSRARVDACGPHAAETLPVLARLNADAKDAAIALYTLHQSMVEVAKEIAQLAGQHAEVKSAHYALCLAAGMRPPFDGAPSLGTEARFSVNERYLAQRVNVYQPRHIRLELAALLNGTVEDADDAAL